MLFILIILISGCTPPTQQRNHTTATGDTITPTYAKGFSIIKQGDDQLLRIKHVGNNAHGFDEFRLVKSLENYTANSGQVIRVPCKRIICLSSTQLTYFFALDKIDPIVGINSSRHLFHAGMNARIKEGFIKKVGKEGVYNTELITSLNPDVIFVSPFKAGGYDALKNLGFPLVPMAAYEEETPLGRAEWMKMIASFVGKEQQADSLFSGLAQRYESLKTLAASATKRPTVFSGKMKSGNWYVPGGNSFYAHYFRDAGARYVIDDNKHAAYPLSFESMYQKAAHCDFWRILLPEEVGFSKAALVAEDARYGDFDAFKNDRIIVCRIREKPYYEESAIKPDIILADYIHYFHPELLPGYKPYFYEYMK